MRIVTFRHGPALRCCGRVSHVLVMERTQKHVKCRHRKRRHETAQSSRGPRRITMIDVSGGKPPRLLSLTAVALLCCAVQARAQSNDELYEKAKLEKTMML